MVFTVHAPIPVAKSSLQMGVAFGVEIGEAGAGFILVLGPEYCCTWANEIDWVSMNAKNATSASGVKLLFMVMVVFRSVIGELKSKLF
jgi:hypothetical protein